MYFNLTTSLCPVYLRIWYTEEMYVQRSCSGNSAPCPLHDAQTCHSSTADDVGHVIADDKDRDVAQVELHNREAEITTDGRLAEGTVMIIKEPYLKAMPDGEYTIRVDHVSEIVFRPILPSSCMDTGPSANDWKVAGNEKFVKGKYYLAKTESCVLFPGDSPV